MSSPKNEFERAKIQLNRRLSITESDIKALEARVLTRITNKKRWTPWIAAVVFGVMICGIGIPAFKHYQNTLTEQFSAANKYTEKTITTSPNPSTKNKNPNNPQNNTMTVPNNQRQSLQVPNSTNNDDSNEYQYSTDVAFGITSIPNGGFLDSKITNQWKGYVNGHLIRAMAGGIIHTGGPDPNIPQSEINKVKQGNLIITDETVWVTQHNIPNQEYKAPGEHGILTITKEENAKLFLSSEDGTKYVFDLNSRSYVANVDDKNLNAETPNAGELQAIKLAIDQERYADFPTQPGIKKGTIHWANPAASFTIDADFETDVAKIDNGYYVILTESWNANDYPQIVNGEKLKKPTKQTLSHSWVYKVTNQAVKLDSDDGDTPPQYSN